MVMKISNGPGGGWFGTPKAKIRKPAKPKRSTVRVAAVRVPNTRATRKASPAVRSIKRRTTAVRSYAPVRKAAPKRTYSAPVRRKAAPKRTYSAPVRRKATPKRTVARAVAPVQKQVARVAAPAPEPVVPQLTEEQMLALDTIYQNQLQSYDDSLDSYQRQNVSDRNAMSRNFKQDSGAIDRNRTNTLIGTSEDFANRGMIRSGGYVQQGDEINSNFGNQKARLTDSYDDNVAKLIAALSNFKKETSTNRETARIQALGRVKNRQVLNAQNAIQ